MDGSRGKKIFFFLSKYYLKKFFKIFLFHIKFFFLQGNQVLYVGDHIYADIIKSKKKNAWRNLLVVPELERELQVWVKKIFFFKRKKLLFFVD
jgi:hypothetical protein